MAINWSTEYENQPVTESNPGYIAQSVQTLKTAIRERMTLEHFFGVTEGASYGDHREGSARAFVTDTEFPRSDRVGGAGGANDVGRLEIDMDVRGTLPEISGTPVTGDQTFNRIFATWDYNNQKRQVFAPDEYVHRNWDLDITGQKRYVNENPEVQEDLSDTTYDAMSSPDKLRADEKAVGRAQIKVWSDEAKEHNVLDILDPDNDANKIETAGGVTNPISSTAFTLDETASVTTLYADAIYGVVYV